MKTIQFQTRVIPVNEYRFAIEVKSVNYHANINTTIIVDRATLEVCEDFECNVFVNALTFLKDLASEIKIALKYDRINRFGMCD